ncbi:MAG: dihydrofolate reductase [Clostridiales bacterium]|jgi:dihydrofolate reductase|nr:dihydrofolate reductase [Clostridiales bacterium]
MDAIVAYYQNWGIGKDGTQPIVIPEDRKRFQEMTEGATVIVGRRTLEDFPDGKPLKNRKNIVMTRQDIEIEGATVAHSVQEVLEMVKDQPRVYVIGGESVYEALVPYCEKIYITKIYAKPECDAFFQNLDEQFAWSFESESEIMTSSTGHRYQYYVYEKYYITDNIKKL